MAQLTREVRVLGPASDDSSIFEFARRSGAILVTANASDFRTLAARARHGGIVSLPALREPGQSKLFRRALPLIVRILSQTPDLFIEISASERVRVIDLS